MYGDYSPEVELYNCPGPRGLPLRGIYGLRVCRVYMEVCIGIYGFRVSQNQVAPSEGLSMASWFGLLFGPKPWTLNSTT